MNRGSSTAPRVQAGVKRILRNSIFKPEFFGLSLMQAGFATSPVSLFSIILCFLSLAPGCNKTTSSGSAGTGANTYAPPPPSAARGKTLYQTQCIACHNSDPKKPGSIGPDVFGSSRELLEARIMKAEYPSGHKPKRSSRAMAPLPHLKNEIESIHLYLNSSP